MYLKMLKFTQKLLFSRCLEKMLKEKLSALLDELEGIDNRIKGKEEIIEKLQEENKFLQKQIDQNTANLTLRLLELKDRVEELENRINTKSTPSETRDNKLILEMEDRIEWFVDFLLEKKNIQKTNRGHHETPPPSPLPGNLHKDSPEIQTFN